MKAFHFLPATALFFLAAPSSLPAQNFDSQDALAVAFPFLTAGQRTELKTDFLNALAKSPDLALQWTTLLTTLEKPMSSSPADIEALRVQIVDFEGKARTAMAADDPNIGPIMDTIDLNTPRVHPELVAPSLGTVPTIPGYAPGGSVPH